MFLNYLMLLLRLSAWPSLLFAKGIDTFAVGGGVYVQR